MWASSRSSARFRNLMSEAPNHDRMSARSLACPACLRRRRRHKAFVLFVTLASKEDDPESRSTRCACDIQLMRMDGMHIATRR